MPILGQLIASLFTGLVAWLANIVGRKWALGMVFVGVFSSLTGALYVALSTVLNAVMIAFPSYSGLELALYVAVPNNLPVVLSAVIGAEVTLTLYAWNIKLLRIMQTGS